MKLNRLFVVAGIAAAIFSSHKLPAQDTKEPSTSRPPDRSDRRDRGGFDPAQIQERMLERIREQMAVKGDDEWKIISDRIQKVIEARRQVGIGGGFGGFRGGPRPGGDTSSGGSTSDRGRSGGFSSFFGQPSPEAEALQKAVDSKVSAATLKAALEKYRASRKEKQAALEKAQADLQKILSVQQEAVAVLNGLLS